ncbi:MAG: ABC transporter ATP-binding protein [Microbacterium enclense]
MIAVTTEGPSPAADGPRPEGWAIALRGVRRDRAGTPVVRDLDLDIDPGQIVAFVGPSGCGATTLLRIVRGAERADAGTVLVDGRSGPTAPRVPGVSDRTPIARFGRVHASIAAVVRRAGAPEPLSEAARLTDLVGLGTGEKLVHRLSRGDRQRWALARALATRSGALVLDDALAALPTAARSTTRERVVRELREREVTTLWFTRDSSEAAAVADRLVVMDHGRIVAAGCPDEMYARVDEPAVAEVLGPVSAVPGIVEGAIVEVWGQELPLVHAVRDGHCEVVVRPENVVLVGPDEAGMDAVVEGTTFLGGARRSTVRTSDGVRVVVEHAVDQRLDDHARVRIALATVPAVIRALG